MSNSEHPFKNFFTGALFGGAIGALAAFLFKTPKGRRIKDDLVDKCHDLSKKMENWDGATKMTKRTKRSRKKHK